MASVSSRARSCSPSVACLCQTDPGRGPKETEDGCHFRECTNCTATPRVHCVVDQTRSVDHVRSATRVSPSTTRRSGIPLETTGSVTEGQSIDHSEIWDPSRDCTGSVTEGQSIDHSDIWDPSRDRTGDCTGSVNDGQSVDRAVNDSGQSLGPVSGLSAGPVRNRDKDSLVPKDHVPRDSLVPKDHVPRDSLVPKDHVPRDSLVPIEHVPKDSLVPKDHVPRDKDSFVPKDHVPKENPHSRKVGGAPKEGRSVSRERPATSRKVGGAPKEGRSVSRERPATSMKVGGAPKEGRSVSRERPATSMKVGGAPKEGRSVSRERPATSRKVGGAPKEGRSVSRERPATSRKVGGAPKEGRSVSRERPATSRKVGGAPIEGRSVSRERPATSRKVGGAPKEGRSVSRERPATSRKVGGAPKEGRSVSRERPATSRKVGGAPIERHGPATSRKVCVSGVSVSRWGRRDGAPNSRAAPPPGRAGDCSITELLSAQHTHGVSSLSDSIVLGTPVRGNRLHLSSLLVNLTPETHTWSRLKAALSLHRKTKAFLTPKRPLYLLSSPEAELGVGLGAELEVGLGAELGDVSQKLFSTPRPPNLRSTILGSTLSVYPLDGELSDDQKVFSECNQTGPLGFQDCLPAARMNLCRKVGGDLRRGLQYHQHLWCVSSLSR
ncbi:uncharacterized protein LOC135570929 [Oncorhynchus nerka]|uniref:uncharacterized protein LOC135570929 n=1 Tax=Oncorhynchus nerka TaxID=8023 RepID=UPI0031B8373C